MASILIVDDRESNRELLTTLLGCENHSTAEARDGAEGLERARTLKPDLIITDILMPTMDGYEFIRRLREDPVTSKNSNVRRPTPQNEGVRFTSPLGEADGRRDTREPLPRSHILEADKPSALAGALPGSTRCSWHILISA